MLDPVNLGVWLISSLQLGSKDCPQVRWNEWGGGKRQGPPEGRRSHRRRWERAAGHLAKRWQGRSEYVGLAMVEIRVA